MLFPPLYSKSPTMETGVEVGVLIMMVGAILIDDRRMLFSWISPNLARYRSCWAVVTCTMALVSVYEFSRIAEELKP